MRLPTTITQLIPRMIILPLCLSITVSGLALTVVMPVAGPLLTIAGLAMLWLLSVSPVADALLRPLEQRFARIDAESAHPEAAPEFIPEFIVVLAAGFTKYRRASGLARISPVSCVRLAEGIRLLHCFDTARLLVCNYFPTSQRVAGDGRINAMFESAIELGVEPQRLIDLQAGYSTHAELVAVRERVGRRPVLSVTSAAHMPRTLRIAHGLGLDCRAAPTDFRVHPADGYFLLRWMPSTHELRKSERAIYEYLAAFKSRF